MKSWLAAAAFGVGLLMANPAQALVLLDDNFDGEGPGTVLNYDSFANWDVTNGTVDIIGGVGGGVSCIGGAGACVDLDGSATDAGTLTSKTAFSFGAGQTISLMFDFSGNQRTAGPDSMTVSLGSFYSEVFDNIPTNQGFSTVVRTFSSGAGGSANLVFKHDGFDFQGIILDNVKLETRTPAVPVPMPLALMGSAVVLAVWKARRARK